MRYPQQQTNRKARRWIRGETPSRDGKTPLLMVAEDDAGVGRAISAWLRRQKIRCVVVQSVRETVEVLGDMLAIESAFDGLLADYRLPDGSGCEVIEAFRCAFPERPAALMSGCEEACSDPWLTHNDAPLFIKPLKENQVGCWLEQIRVRF